MAPVDGNCTEFTASTVQRYFRDEADLRHHCMETLPLWHSEMAERAIRSIKERLYRYFTHQGTQCWTRVIQRIVSALNASPNSSIFGMRPRDVTFANSTALRKRLAEKAASERSGRAYHRPRFRIGDWMRIERHNHMFEKGYLARFTREVFIVDQVCGTRTPINAHKLRDVHGEPINGRFYANDLCLVLPHDKYGDKGTANNNAADEDGSGKVYAIERVVRRRRQQNGEEHCLVKWKGFSTRHNSCIPASSII